MPTIGDVYDPLITAARAGDQNGHVMLREVGKEIFANNPQQCPNLEDGVAAAKRNLDYYCQYCDADTARTVKAFYGLGSGFRDLGAHKHAFD